MFKSALIGFLTLFLVAGCSTLSDYFRLKRWDESNKTFETAMRWSDFEAAAAFLPPEKAEKIDFQKLKNIKVTGYTVKRMVVSDTKSNVGQLIEFNFFKKNVLVERSLMFEQLWEYDTEKKKWFLTSGFPEFK